jgi:hypothetical protein
MNQSLVMPYVSMFFGIIIRMFYNDHAPPHFHAEYQGTNGLFNFNGDMIQGNIKSKIALKLIKQWAKLRSNELEANWANIEKKLEINKIAPIE